MFAGDLRRQRVSRMREFRRWRWSLNEMYVKLNGEMVYLYRAVDQEGEILQSYIRMARDKDAARSCQRNCSGQLGGKLPPFSGRLADKRRRFGPELNSSAALTRRPSSPKRSTSCLLRGCCETNTDRCDPSSQQFTFPRH